MGRQDNVDRVNTSRVTVNVRERRWVEGGLGGVRSDRQTEGGRREEGGKERVGRQKKVRQWNGGLR
jgi:hypothetical protein